jgi:hypothetical protein
VLPSSGVVRSSHAESSCNVSRALTCLYVLALLVAAISLVLRLVQNAGI